MQLFLWLSSYGPQAGEEGMGKLRVLIAGDSIPPKVDGVSVRADHLVKHLRQLGHEVHILTSIRHAQDSLHGASVTQLPGWRSRLYPQHSMSIPTPAVLGTILRFKPHVVHILDESFLAAAVQMCASACMVPTVWSHHTRLDLFLTAYIPALATAGFNHWGLQALRWLIAACGQVHLSVGQDMVSQLHQAGCRRISVWECGCDTERFNPALRYPDVSVPPATGTASHEEQPLLSEPEAAEVDPASTPQDKDAGPLCHGISPGTTSASLQCSLQAAYTMGDGRAFRSLLTHGQVERPIILYVGRMAPEKNLHVYPSLIRSITATHVAQGKPAPVWLFVGDGPYLDPLRQAAWQQGLAPHTLFLGQIVHSREDAQGELPLGSLYANSDLFFSPSTCETLGQVFQEALSCETLAVGMRAGGVPEVIRHGQRGLLVDVPARGEGGAASIRAMAAGILQGLSVRDRPEGQLMRKAGRAHVLSKSWSRAMDQACAAYWTAMGMGTGHDAHGTGKGQPQATASQ